MEPSQPDADMLPHLLRLIVVDVACQVQPQVRRTIRILLRVSAGLSGSRHGGQPDAQAAVSCEDQPKMHV
jgi:hypothetical protein